ncbi:extensin family protein [Roseivivax marinus]|uniref:extensin-like domain-containing protein n=1 Tax=Roseivivax marinus TaxID=1379903 RepID=UPI001F04BF0E|nr:extensin family protein [Roseivivax marinus]UMA64770.1 extensin family protein [Roseivivax marinus]
MIRLVLLSLALAGPAAALAPDTSLRPAARADYSDEGTNAAADSTEGKAVSVPPEDDAGLRRTIVARLSAANRPAARPDSVAETVIAAQLLQRWERMEPVPRADPIEEFPGYEGVDVRAFAQASPQAVATALRPILRTKELVQKAMARQQERRRGQICGDPAIQGEAVGYLPGRINACGIADGVKVRAVSGIPLSQQALIDCTTARALKSWVDRGLKPAVGNAGGGVAEIRIAAHYACRTRNNQPGAKVSEHGKGRAIDISAIRLRDGTNMTVLGGWRTQNQGPILRRAYGAACGIFGTTLGPDSDRFHQDHFHFDTARYRSGSYCR